MLSVPVLGEKKWPEDHELLAAQCWAELNNPEFRAYQHGNRNTRQRGCNGPMCRKAARDYGRELQRRINDAQRERISTTRRFDEFLDAFTAYAHEVHRQSGLVPPRRRTFPKKQDNLPPVSVVQMLHRGRARLAS